MALAALALLLWRSTRPADAAEDVLAVRADVGRSLGIATRQHTRAMDVQLDSVPGPIQRDWLAAIRGAGTRIAWRATDVRATAVAATSLPDPQGRVRIAVAAQDSGGRIVLSDDLGVIDTVIVASAAASRIVRTATGVIAAEERGSRATTSVRGPAAVRRVLVVGSAGWESKFAIAALEEAGWPVDARIRVAPGVERRSGVILSLDTARYSAVVALDGAAAAVAPAIVRFVNAGGGAILGAAAARSGAFARISPASVGTVRAPGARGGVGLAGIKADAVVLESNGGTPVVAARRSELGRTITTGYDQTWKWRMSREDSAPLTHREWWSTLLTAVAYAPRDWTRDSTANGDQAPVAALHAALGAPSSFDAAARAGRRWFPPGWLLMAIVLTGLLAEVFSRRLRGLT